MSSTADRWFVSGQEYHDTINDYAVLGQSAALVRSDILQIDNATDHKAGDTFFTEYNCHGFGSIYLFAYPGRLLYADVDDEDPAHEEKVKQWAKELPIEEKSEKTIETRQELVKALIKEWFPHGLLPREDNGKKMTKAEQERWTQGHLNLLIAQGRLEEPINSRILTANSVEEKEEFLNLMSGQIMHRTKRPVLTLVDMVNSKQSTEVGETKGWVAGYDFIKDLVVIKPFVSKKGKHPLGSKWYGNVAQDGVSFSGTPQEFAKAYVELGKNVDAGNEKDGFKMLVHTLTAKWMIRFGKDLVTAYGAEFQTDLLAVSEAKKKIKEAMGEIKFPVVEKNKKEPRLEIGPLLSLQANIEIAEHDIRDAAIDAKQRGEIKMGQDAAKLYESIKKQIKAFNENPSMDDAAIDAKERGEIKMGQNAAKLYESINKQIEAFMENPSMDDAAIDAKGRGAIKMAQNAAKLYESIHKQIKAFNENPSADL